MKDANRWLTVLLALAVTFSLGGVAAAITVDGSISDWSSKYIYSDASGDGPGEAEIENWGFFYQSFTATDPGYLYAFIETSRTFADYNTGDNDAWPGLFIDVDHYSGPLTYEWGLWRATSPTNPGSPPEYQSVYKGPSMTCAAPGHLPAEWRVPERHMGVDIEPELGINTAHWGEGWNYWGWGDAVGTQGSPIVGGSYATGGNYLEMQVPIDDLIAEVQRLPDYNANGFRHNGKINGLWKVAPRMEASIGGVGPWGVDAAYAVWVPILGDSDGDGDCDLDDFADLAIGFGSTGLTLPADAANYSYDNTVTSSWESGDFDLDGDVDLDDFAFLAVTFNQDILSLSPGGANAVPEPLTLALLGLGGLLLRRRRS